MEVKINYQVDLLRTLKSVNTKDNDETLLGVGWSLCRCKSQCPLQNVCRKLSVNPVLPESIKAIKINCNPLRALPNDMIDILRRLTLFKDASYEDLAKDLAWTVVEEELHILSTPTRLVPHVTWCLTWFTTRSLVLLKLPKAMLKELHKQIPKAPGDPISHLGYASPQGIGLHFINDPEDMQFRANLPSVVHAIEFFDEEEWEKKWGDMEDIGGAAKEKAKEKAKRTAGFIRMPKDAAERLSPTIVTSRVVTSRGRGRARSRGGGRGRGGRTP